MKHLHVCKPCEKAAREARRRTPAWTDSQVRGARKTAKSVKAIARHGVRIATEAHRDYLRFGEKVYAGKLKTLAGKFETLSRDAERALFQPTPPKATRLEARLHSLDWELQQFPRLEG